MASLSKLPSGTFRAVLTKYDPTLKTKAKQRQRAISLSTKSRGVADMRMKEVERYKDEIFAGNQIEWSWFSDKTSTEVKYTKLKDAFKDFMVFQKHRKKVSKSQRETNKTAFKVLLEVDGNILVRDLSEKILDKLCKSIDALNKKNGEAYK